jgi:hypothetical protein
VYYVDGDLIESVVKNGLSKDIPQTRTELLRRGKEKLK